MAKRERKKSVSKAPPQPNPKKPQKAQPKKRTDRRGTPKGKATKAGGAGVHGKAQGGKIGNPPHVPSAESRRIAETHAAVGTPHWAIAAEMGISPDTLERHYSKELSLGLIRMNARIGSNVAKKALEGSSEHERFWLARRGGPAWANKQQTELSGPNGAPIEYRELSDEELDARIAKLTSHAAANARY